MSFPCQIKSFDINTVCFGDLSWCQHTFFSPSPESNDLSLLFLNQGLINNKNKFLYQNQIEKILRYCNCMISVIFKI